MLFSPCLVVNIRGLTLNQHPRSIAHAMSFSVPVNQCNTGLFRFIVRSIDERTGRVAPLEWMLIIRPITIGLGPDMVASHIPFQLVPKLQ